MASDEIDRAEIDRLVKVLAAPLKRQAPKTAVAAPAAKAAAPPEPVPAHLAPGRPWTTARLLMPADRREPREWFAFLSAISLPALPKIALPTLNLNRVREWLRLPTLPAIARPTLDVRRWFRLPTLPPVAWPALDVSQWIRLPTLPRIALPSLNDMQWNCLSTRAFVGLGVLLSAAMPYWPYSHAWSWGLLLYLSAVELIVVTGIWGAKLTWDARLPAAHTASVVTVFWGVGLLAAETVPRIVYA